MTAHPAPDTEDPGAHTPETAVPDRAALAALGHDQRVRALHPYVLHELGRLLKIHPNRIDTRTASMKSLGIGSIAGLELQHRLQNTLHVEIDLPELLRAPCTAALVDRIARQLRPAPATPAHLPGEPA